MDLNESRQHLESCLLHQQQKHNDEVAAIQELLDNFKNQMSEVVISSNKLKFGFVEKAQSILFESKSEVTENRIRLNNQIKKSTIRITGGIFLIYLLFSVLVGIKAAVDNQFCNFYNVEGRTQRYETQKPCKR